MRSSVSHRARGFTLLELLQAVGVLAVLLAIAIPTYLIQRRHAQDRAAQADLTSAATQARAFYVKNGESYEGLELQENRPADWVAHRGEPIAVERLHQHVVCLTTTSASGTEWVLLIVSAPVDGYEVGHTFARADELEKCGNGGGDEAGDDGGDGDGSPGAPEVEWAMVAAGGYHACALTLSGHAYCWGSNWTGELGTGTPDMNSPVPLPVYGDITFETITVGYSHTCGLTTAGEAYCWGYNEYGQLGTGSTNNAHTPHPVSGGHKWQTLSGGFNHTCGLTTDGDAYCWGRNKDGQLGTDEPFDASTPRPVAGEHEWKSISAGGDHTCGITTDGDAYCWGLNDEGQLGTDEPSSASTPRPVAGGHKWEAIWPGAWHTCGLTTDGNAYCWGGNTSGQLGTDDYVDATAPRAVPGDLEWEIVAAGYMQTCGLTTDGEAYCWGRNNYGQLGIGDTETWAIPTPQAVSTPAGVAGWKDISPSYYSVCGLTTDGDAYCWGLNDEGQLGNGSEVDAATPKPVADPETP